MLYDDVNEATATVKSIHFWGSHQPEGFFSPMIYIPGVGFTNGLKSKSALKYMNLSMQTEVLQNWYSQSENLSMRT